MKTFKEYLEESRAMKILQSKMKELDTRKRFETGQARIPTAKEREEQMKKKNVKESRVMSTKELQRIPLNKRSDKQQAAIDAAKASKPKAGKADIHIKHEDGTVSKHTVKLTKKDWEDESQKAAEGILKNLQYIHDQFPKTSGSKAKEIHKVVIK